MSGQLHTITIEKIIPNGFGMGRTTEGKIVLVRYVLPGEKVEVRPTRQKKQYSEAELVSILEPAPERCEPACDLYGKCGGCDLQHTDASFQLQLKMAMLSENLIREGLDAIAVKTMLQPLFPSPKNLGYRQRIHLQVNGSGKVGFYHMGTHTIISTTHCPIAHPSINFTLDHIHVSRSLGKLLKLTHSLELLYNPGSGKTIILFHFSRSPRPADRILAETVQQEANNIEYILFHEETHGYFWNKNGFTRPLTPPLLQLDVPKETTGLHDLTLAWEAGGFSQVNIEQNLHMVNFILQKARPEPHQRILDLYCGMGNFSLPLSLYAHEVVGIDGQGSAIRSAKRNTETNQEKLTKESLPNPLLLNNYFEKASVPAWVKKHVLSGKKFDFVLLDPPRQGAPEIMALLPEFGAKRIVYISCNPATLARDLKILQTAGYQANLMQPFDMFPQTHHLETVTFLERIK
jgi:23S rRNA (uracil1939-C5)-methyltransferase